MVYDIEMNKIAFDLDGVFVPDCDQFPNIGGLTEFYALTYYMRPLFKPNFEWHIITGRHAKHRASTMSWIDKHFTNKPLRVWHESVNEPPQEYKAEVINQNQIDVFVESDIEQVEYLQAHTKARIIHFDSFLSTNLII